MDRNAMLRAAAVAAAVAAAACSREQTAGVREVAARVNGGDIPAARVQAALERGGIDAPARSSQAKSRALEAAIDQELLVQKALSARLDRDPDVMRALDESRRRILAQAWLDRTLADRTRPDPAQVDAFYAANPALFGARRIYCVRELHVSLDGRHDAASLRAAAAQGDAARLEQWLAREGLRFQASERTEPAEALPLALLARLASMKDGDVAVVEADGGVSVVELRRSLAAPLDEKHAAPMIERFLASHRRSELVHETLARLRDAAHIEYVGGKAVAAPPSRAASGARARAVHTSIESPYDQPTQPGIAAASAATGKERS